MGVLQLLLSAGATLCMSGGELASRLCSCVAAGEGEVLRRYVAAGADVNVADYDKRTALHIAAAEGKMEMVSEGGGGGGVSQGGKNGTGFNWRREVEGGIIKGRGNGGLRGRGEEGKGAECMAGGKR